MSTINSTIIDFTAHITVDKFLSRFPTIESVQNAMNKVVIYEVSHRRNIYDYIEDEKRDKQTVERDKRELEKLRVKIPILEKNLEQAGNEDLIKEMTAELIRTTLRFDQLEKRLGNRDAGDLLVDEMKFISSRANAEAIEAWVEKLGQWFSEGHLGPGSVTYKDKTYTAQ
jgi:hypothetical protein